METRARTARTPRKWNAEFIPRKRSFPRMNAQTHHATSPALPNLRDLDLVDSGRIHSDPAGSTKISPSINHDYPGFAWTTLDFSVPPTNPPTKPKTMIIIHRSTDSRRWGTELSTLMPSLPRHPAIPFCSPRLRNGRHLRITCCEFRVQPDLIRSDPVGFARIRSDSLRLGAILPLV